LFHLGDWSLNFRLLDGCLAIGSDGVGGVGCYDLSVTALSKGSPAAKVRLTEFTKGFLPWEPKTFIFRGYNFGGVKPSFFMVLGSKGRWWQLKHFWNFHPENWGRFPF